MWQIDTIQQKFHMNHINSNISNDHFAKIVKESVIESNDTVRGKGWWCDKSKCLSTAKKYVQKW